jgi:hypothetical protein
MRLEDPDFASAAVRHLRDAEHLAEAGAPCSPDQAWHLAGFAHECARKAYLHDGWIPKLLGHEFHSAGERILELAQALDPRASRFPVGAWAQRYPMITAWRPDHRYERTGATARNQERDLATLLVEARTAVDACIVALFLDGALAIESLR